MARRMGSSTTSARAPARTTSAARVPAPIPSHRRLVPENILVTGRAVAGGMPAPVGGPNGGPDDDPATSRDGPDAHRPARRPELTRGPPVQPSTALGGAA